MTLTSVKELFQQTSGLLAAERLLVPAGDDREAARQRAAAAR